jgi:hypothetical protein
MNQESFKDKARLTEVAGPGDPPDFPGDLIRGVRAIAAYINEPERRTAYLLERGYLPGGKVGAYWCASKRKLREHYDRVTDGRAA